jgi:hypothetical protein
MASINNAIESQYLRLSISVATSLAVAFASWFLIGYCPRSAAGIDALENIYFWAGQACENQQGLGGSFYIFASFWILALQSLLTFAILSASPRASRNYMKTGAIAIVFLGIYLLLFAL